MRCKHLAQYKGGGGILICTRDQSILLFLILTILIPIFIFSCLVFCSSHTFTINFQFPLLRKAGRSIGYWYELALVLALAQLYLYSPLHNCTCTTSDISNNQILPLLLITLNSFLFFIKGMIVQCTKYIHLNGKQVFHEPIFRTRARGAILFVSDF